jgi:hypothetical protein
MGGAEGRPGGPTRLQLSSVVQCSVRSGAVPGRIVTSIVLVSRLCNSYPVMLCYSSRGESGARSSKPRARRWVWPAVGEPWLRLRRIELSRAEAMRPKFRLP